MDTGGASPPGRATRDNVACDSFGADMAPGLRPRSNPKVETDDGSDAATVETAPSLPAPAVPTNGIPGYELRREINRGGQGVVYLAVQQSTGRRVAVKVLREGPFASSGERARFDREALILAALDHPNIVAVLDRGVTAGGSAFFVMDYVGGLALDEYLAARRAAGPAGHRALLALFLKICDAVNAAHLRGVVHRDLKPSNIRVDDGGEPHILDFGLARPGLGMSGAAAPVTTTGQFLGSLPWTSPEQAQGAGDAIDTRSDVYSLGVILYQMLTGSFPYPVTGGVREVLEHIVTTPPAPLAGRAGVDALLEAITLRALSKARDERYQSAGELARDVASYLAGRPTVAGSMAAGNVWRRSGWRRVAAPVLTVAVAFAVVAYVRSRGAGGPPSTADGGGGAAPDPGGGATSMSLDALTATVGQYPPAAALPAELPRIGVPPFKVKTASTTNPISQVELMAADQLSTLLHLTGRFETHERAQVEQLLDEQNMEGIVRPGELPGRLIRGVDYLVIGRVSNFRVTRERTNDTTAAGGRRVADRIVTECGVDIRLVDPSTGRTAVAQFGEFRRADTLQALGIRLANAGPDAAAELTIEADDAGKILRLALDDAVRKMLPAIDRELARRAAPK